MPKIRKLAPSEVWDTTGLVPVGRTKNQVERTDLVGSLLRQVRSLYGLTVTDVANLADVDKGQMTKVENSTTPGEPYRTVTKVVRDYARALGVGYDDVLYPLSQGVMPDGSEATASAITALAVEIAEQKRTEVMDRFTNDALAGLGHLTQQAAEKMEPAQIFRLLQELDRDAAKHAKESVAQLLVAKVNARRSK